MLLTIKYMNIFSYSITTLFIPSNKDYHSCYNLHSTYQMCPNNGHLNRGLDIERMVIPLRILKPL